MELVLSRHARPVRRELETGAADPELSEDGVRQAVLLAEYLALEQIDVVYSSPMRRARETAQPLCDVLGLPMQIEPDVAEFDQHSSEYIPIEELKASGDPRLREFLLGEGEEFDDRDEFRARVLTSMQRIVSNHSGQRVAVVCHGGVINLYAGDVLGLDVDGPGFFYPNYTSITRVAASRSGVRSIITLNETSHLRHTGLPMGLFQHG